jgi:prefoldin alpha subunit
MENNQNFEQQLYQFRYLREQRDMLAQQLEIINASLGNLLTTKTTTENLKEVKEGEEILVPIGGMISLKAKIMNPEKVLLYVSQDVIVEKDLDGTIEFIDKLIEQHKEQINYLGNQIQNFDINLQGMSNLIQRGRPQQ